MKMIIAGTVTALMLGAAVSATPASAQRVVIGPGGVGLGIGARPYGGYAREPYARRGQVYEGRSAYRGERRGGAYRD